MARASLLSFASATPLVAPAQAQAAGFNTLVFHDQFKSLNTVDLTNSLKPGFKWYLNNAWPDIGGVPSAQLTRWQTFPAQLAANLSMRTDIPGSDLCFFSEKTPVSAQPAYLCMMSAGYSPDAPGYVGQAFGGGAYIEARYARPLGNPNTIAFWTNPIEWLTGQTQTFMELDMDDQGAPARFTWDYTYDNGGLSEGGGAFTSPWPGAADTGFHTYGMLWRTAAQAPPNGQLVFFYDDVQHGGGPFNSTAQIDSQNLVLTFSNGISSPLRHLAIDWVRVWK